MEKRVAESEMKYSIIHVHTALCSRYKYVTAASNSTQSILKHFTFGHSFQTNTMLSKIALLSLLASLAAAAPTPQISAPITTPRGNPAGVISLGPGTSTITTWPNYPSQWDRPWPNAP